MSHLDLDAATRTVVDVSAHVGRLCTSAAELQQQFETGARGYFTPSEDDAVQALWVAYHSGRNALFELIRAIRAEVRTPSEEAIAEFVVAYGAATVLIDAARFLRDLFGGDALVRRKLNESFEQFGIPAGSFDAIQMSLTNPANALAINNANQFFDEHHATILATSSEDAGLRAVLGVIEARRHRANVSKRRFVKVRVDDRGRQLRDIVVRDGMLRVVYALQELGSRFVSSLTTMPGHEPQLPDAIRQQLRDALRPGDVFVTRKESAVTNYFLPGYWPHAALYVGNGQVVEALKDGVQERSLHSPFSNDAVAVIRPALDDHVVQQAIQRAYTHVGKPYDFDFDFTRADRMVCTEVVYRSYEGVSGVRFTLSKRAGRQTLSAEDLLKMALAADSFSPLAVYCRPHGDELLSGDAMVSVLHCTMA